MGPTRWEAGKKSRPHEAHGFHQGSINGPVEIKGRIEAETRFCGVGVHQVKVFATQKHWRSVQIILFTQYQHGFSEAPKLIEAYRGK